MANVSDANGYFTIDSKDENAVKAMVYLMELLDCDEYGTYFKDYLSDENMYDKVCEKDDGTYFYGTTFSGTGRWTYETNIERMMKWIEYEALHFKEDIKIMEYLEDQDYSITFDFVDYECGNEIFYSKIMQVIHHAGRPFTDVEIKDLAFEALDLTVVGYASAMGRTFDEAMTELYLWGESLEDQDANRREEIMDILNDQKKEIEAYFKKPLSKLIELI